ncbi:hypothetical protein [Caulobacter sp. NIBR1757]|uniref:hypothetical protein n=1 Tax=Caulobacter sp. NIBR1757 TaxID=3016000 RepID=UPI0022F04FFE|nr:hypothetical protein [Caulobacter sp. NIBR1757]WGM39894.1 hypothetical protein AMEJIAPC_02834 [Caulobacter sp. NIBR1757]
MTPDDKIAAFLRSARPASEPSFNASVMKAIARRQLEQSLLVAALAAIVGGLVLWAVAPVLASVLEPAAQSMATGVAVLTATLSLVGMGQMVLRPREA